jgi:hypothetical protein
VGEIGILLKLLREDALLGKGAADGEGVSHGGPLRFPPQRQQLPHVVDQPRQLEPVFVRMDLSDPLGSLEEMKGVGLRTLSKREIMQLLAQTHEMARKFCHSRHIVYVGTAQKKNLRQDPIHQ